MRGILPHALELQGQGYNMQVQVRGCGERAESEKPYLPEENRVRFSNYGKLFQADDFYGAGRLYDLQTQRLSAQPR